MKHNKPRHNPNKPQNKYGEKCKCYLSDYSYYCPARHLTIDEIEKLCHFKAHNCVKVKYKLFASVTDRERQRIVEKHIDCCNYLLNK